MNGFTDYLRTREKQTRNALSLFIAGLFLLFFSSEIPLLAFLDLGIPKHVFVIFFLVLAVVIAGTTALNVRVWTQGNAWKAYEKLLLVLLPGALILFLCLTFAKASPVVFQLGLGLYFIAAGVFLFHRYVASQPMPGRRLTAREWLRSQGQSALFFIIVFTSVFFLSGLHRITEFAAVDEPLWLEGRIGKYWNNIAEGDWDSTDVSDKPGITVALASGAGLFFKDPKDFDTLRYQPVEPGRFSGLERFYLVFRFPLLAVITLLLPFFYFFLERLAGKPAALVSYGLIATSPILIGMSKIINPDSLLWVFVPLSLLSYLVFLKSGWYRYLVIAGIFFGFALLTKYVANILLIFLFALMFLEHLYHRGKNTVDCAAFIKKALTDLAFYLFFALSIFYVLLPAVWVEPKELIESTLLSEAFVKVAPLFILVLALLLGDQYFNRARLVSFAMEQVARFKLPLGLLLSGLFFGALLFCLGNVWSGMRLVDFITILQSPKNIADQSDFLAAYLTNFYPLTFGVAPLALLGLLAGAFLLFRKNFWENDRLRLSFYFILFILLYYFGGTINGVAAIVRYQIVLFPLAAIIAGIALSEMFSRAQARWHWSASFSPALPLLVLASGIFILGTTPHPLSYASSLLPGKYYTDIKDMGPGSYEIAQMLNALPSAEKLVIWTDKDGVCKFFLGVCRRAFSPEVLRGEDYDYIVVSSARQNRTSGIILRRLNTHPDYLPLHTYYLRDDPVFTVLINDRPSHYVKAFAYPKQ